METKMISAGEALDWMMKNPNLLIEDDTGTQWRFSSFENMLQRLSSSHWISDFFAPAEALLKFKLPIAPEPAAATPATTMTPGQALDWMIANPGKGLVDNEDARIRVHVLRGVQCAPANGQWSDDDVSALIGHTFRIPARVLPKLPEGCRWEDSGICDIPDNTLSFKISKQRDRDILAALVEEFDTRPK